MNNLTFNQFTKELNNRGIGKQEAYLFSLIYERQLSMAGDLDRALSLLELFATQLQNFVVLREQDVNAIKQLKRDRQMDGVSVESVAHDPSTE